MIRRMKLPIWSTLTALAAVIFVHFSPLRSASLQEFVEEKNARNGQNERRYCRALPGYQFEFPRDHFSHPCYRVEWWYFTGNLAAEDGQRFGYELTFFRVGVDNRFPNPSRWRVDNLYLAHFAISDLGKQKFFYTQRLNRAGIELAGASQSKGRIWNGDWVAELTATGWKLEAAEGDNRIRFQMRSLKPPVIQGQNGVSQKAAGEGNASHYYSLTRLETSGLLETGGASYDLQGWSWMDHEFATNQLQHGQAGWDWISLQMDDGTEWMLYRLRRTGGDPDPHSAGSFIAADGRVVQLMAEDFQMLPLEQWHSPHTGGLYPIRWRVLVPSLGLDVEIRAAMPDQELVTRESTGLNYWEGSILVRGTKGGKTVQGRGYLEMTGYAGPLQPELYPSESRTPN